MFDQLLQYFIENKLLSMEQFGFRPGHSTELAAVRLVDQLTSQMDNNLIPINIYIDLSKAFDTLNHAILLSKFNYYGVTGCANNLLQCNWQIDTNDYMNQESLIHYKGFLTYFH